MSWWPFGSNDFSKNEEAARADFLSILRALDQEGSAGSEWTKFSNGFKATYEMYKKQLKTKEGLAKPRGDKTNFSHFVEEILDQTVGYVEEYQREKNSEKLGKGVGIFLAAMQFGLGSGYFDHHEFGQSVIERVKSMMASLHKVNRSIKCAQMASRVLKIQYETRTTGRYSPTESVMGAISALLSESMG
ncbi:MAG TPA: hypothetical protein VJG90_05830 [Candidatus Nanoarchaeia archaeon]|nr:hypothetical protein [Candidatus Nanoarchaeia archaeon]